MEGRVNTNVLVVPGIGGSGPQHWQTRWELLQPSFTRVKQKDWDTPLCSDWVQVLEKAVAVAGPNTVLVAHSLGCLLVAHWAAQTAQTIRGALLVAAPDPQAPSFPAGAQGFSPVPLQRLPFESVVVASTNDPYGSVEYLRRSAEHWGSRFVCIAEAGHINAESGLGVWSEGFEILKTLLD
jgi:predicted alpha/beta hydrolase family esterase